MWPGLIVKYKEFLPITESTPVITLQEGNTPLIPMGDAMGVDFPLYAKYEGVNPTGSFKDRGMTVAVSKALEEGSQAVICASTGNTAASAAAYAARAGLPSFVLIPQGAVALGKLAQALVHGAVVIAVAGNFDDALQIARQLAAAENLTLVNSLNPYRLQGQKTAAFELVEQLGGAPSHLCLPVGNAGNIAAYWQGFQELKAAGRLATLPAMLGFQAAGAAPIVQGRPVPSPQTIATAIRIGNPASWEKAVAARDESKGAILAVSDEEILAAYTLLAQRTGIFCEPASAASLAGFLKLQARGHFRPQEGLAVVCVLTGHGLKDVEIAHQQAHRQFTVQADYEKVRRIILDHTHH